MSDHGQSAERVRPVVPKLNRAKTPSSAKKPDTKSVRAQLHLGENTVKRLGVHCSLVGKNQSKTADEILLGWLARFGKGREIFEALPVDSTDTVESVD